MWFAWGRGELFTEFRLRGPLVRGHCEELGVVGRISLRCTLERQEPIGRT
jgi:hypothetical protein